MSEKICITCPKNDQKVSCHVGFNIPEDIFLRMTSHEKILQYKNTLILFNFYQMTLNKIIVLALLYHRFICKNYQNLYLTLFTYLAFLLMTF